MKKVILALILIVVLTTIIYSQVEAVLREAEVEEAESDKFTTLMKADSNAILLKSRQFIPSEGIDAITIEKIKARVPKRTHILIQFDHIPNKAERKELEKKGVKLLSYIPNKAWFASIPSEKPEEIAALPNVRAIDEILPEDKISPYIRKYGVGPWARNDDGTVNLTIMFFNDVSLDEASQMISSDYGKVIGKSTLINALVVIVSEESISDLANEDSVQWISEVPPDPKTCNDGSRAAIGVDTVQEAPYNLDGTGIVAGEWDSGHADATHDDLENRVIYGDSAPVKDHSTHVAGTMLGDGTLSAAKGGTALQWRGMATNATVISYEWWDDINELDSEYDEAINIYAISLSTNSWGYTYIDCGDECYGEYDDGAAAIDAVITGNKNKRISIMWAAGNERPNCDNGEYDCIIMPGTAKNTMTVGATNSNDDSMTSWSSWGPTNDGRLKPEVVAPGCEVGGDGGITSTVPKDSYDTYCGTSMSTPAVSGSVALMLQDFRDVHNIYPLPSTIKAVLLHTAKDLGSTGPDYSYGYGRINVKTAIDLIRSDNETNDVIVEGEISQGEVHEFSVSISGQVELKITLVWDDYKGTPAAAKALVNDLDLVLIDPNGGEHYPWVLNPSSPSSSATKGVDNLNNVEQVYVLNPIDGTWTVKVNGTAIPNPPQNYSIVSSVRLAKELIVALDKPTDPTLSNVDEIFLMNGTVTCPIGYDCGDVSAYAQFCSGLDCTNFADMTTTSTLSTSDPNPYDCGSLGGVGNPTICYPQWNVVGKDAGIYEVRIHANSTTGMEVDSIPHTIHFYPGSGVSAYRLDWDKDGSNDYVLENEHLISIFDGEEYTDYSILYLYQKDTDVAYTFGKISDPDSIGRGEITTSNMKDIEFYSFAFSQEGENLASVDLEIRVNVTDPPKETTTLSPTSVKKVSSDPLLCPDDPLSECRVTNGYFYPDGTTQVNCTDVYMYDDGSEEYDCSFATDQDAASGAYMQCEFDVSAIPSGSMLDNITYHYNYYSTQSGSQSFDFKYYDCSAASWVTAQSHTVSGVGEGDFYSNNYASAFSWWEQCASMLKFRWVMTSPNWVGPKVITLANDMCSLGISYTPPGITTSFNLTIQMQKETVDYLVYKLYNFDQNISDINDIFPVISGTLGPSVDDDRYHLEDGSDGLITSLTADQWNDYTISNYALIYDDSNTDSINNNVIAFVRFNETETITFQDVGLWYDSSYATEGLRMRYNTTTATQTDEVYFILAFTKGDYSTIDQWMSNITDGIFPDPNFMTPPTAEFISITLIGYPIEFGNLNPNTENSPAPGNSEDQYIIRVESETTINVDLYKKGDDFTSSDSILDIANMTWYTIDDVALSIETKNNYDTENPIATNVLPDTNISMYYWIDIPSTKAGDYNSTIYIKAVEAGSSP